MRSLVALSFLLASSGMVAAPVAYTLDPNHTQVQFNWNHLQYSTPEAGFDSVTGTLAWDADDITKSSVDVTIAVDSVHSHIAVLDAKLKSAEFLDAQRYPTIYFVSTGVKRLDDSGNLQISGNLTVHGTTKPISLDAHLNRVGVYPMLEVPAAGFSASAVIKRSEFGVGEGIPFVGDELKVHITAEALEAVGFAKAMKAFAAKSEATQGKQP